MTKPMLLRLASLLALVWIVTAMTAWLIVDPSDNLVAARGGRGGARSVEDLAPRDLHPAAKTLEKVALWGIRRDGSAGQPGAAKKTEEKPLEWRVIALVAKTDEKYLLVRIAGQPSKMVKENENLPDGRRVTRIQAKMYAVENADGAEETVILNF